MNRPTMVVLGLATLGAVGFLVMRSDGGPSGRATGDALDPAEAQMWTYPADGATNVEFSWDGKDAPQPAAPPQGYPSGPVITLQATQGGALVVSKVGMHAVEQGDEIEVTVLASENDAYLNAETIAVIPHRPLEPVTTYMVEIMGEVAGESFHKEWSFTTRREGCDLLAQDCNPGRGCFLLSTGRQCLWAGQGYVGQACQYPTECMAGLTCMGSSCVPLCDSSETPNDETIACSNRCSGGTFLVPGAEAEEPARLCVLESCIEDPSVCEDSEGCFWLGGFVCAEAGTGAHGSECAQASDCERGTSCLGHEGQFSCRTLCGGPGMPACSDACGDEALLFDAEHQVSFCP
mgnify:CR=1 FL=1